MLLSLLAGAYRCAIPAGATETTARSEHQRFVRPLNLLTGTDGRAVRDQVWHQAYLQRHLHARLKVGLFQQAPHKPVAPVPRPAKALTAI